MFIVKYQSIIYKFKILIDNYVTRQLSKLHYVNKYFQLYLLQFPSKMRKFFLDYLNRNSGIYIEYLYTQHFFQYIPG